MFRDIDKWDVLQPEPSFRVNSNVEVKDLSQEFFDRLGDSMELKR